MKTPKEYKLSLKIAGQQKQVIADLELLARDIDRCEQTMHQLRSDLDRINANHADRKTTLEDVHYLEDLLACARKKLIWEKRLESVRKRTPELMRRVESLVNHPLSAPDEPTRAALLNSLNQVKDTIQRVQTANLGSCHPVSSPASPEVTSENGANPGGDCK